MPIRRLGLPNYLLIGVLLVCAVTWAMVAVTSYYARITNQDSQTILRYEHYVEFHTGHICSGHVLDHMDCDAWTDPKGKLLGVCMSRPANGPCQTLDLTVAGAADTVSTLGALPECKFSRELPASPPINSPCVVTPKLKAPNDYLEQ